MSAAAEPVPSPPLPPPPPPPRERLTDLAFQAVPAIGSAIGFVGFVAIVGSAIAWAQFRAVGLPADQAVRVMARQDLVATGALPLFAFVALGALAVVIAYAGRDVGSYGAGVAFLALAVTEASVAFLWVADHEHTLIVAGGFLLVAALLVTLGRTEDERAQKVLAGLLLVLAVVAVVLLTFDRTTRWLAITVASAILVNLLVYRIMRMRRTPGFGFYAAVFLSVVVVGGVATVGRAHTSPKLHPAVVLRKSDGVALCGVLISETDKRVYLGDLGAGKSDRNPSSDQDEHRVGSIYWVPDGDVDMLRIGSAVAADDVASAATALASRVYADRAENHPKAAAPAKTVVTTGGTVRTTTDKPTTEPPTLQPPADPPCTVPGGKARTVSYAP